MPKNELGGINQRPKLDMGKLAPILGALLSYGIGQGQGGYGGLAAGQFAGAHSASQADRWNRLQQEQAAARERAEYDYLQKQRQGLERFGRSMAGELRTLGQGTPGMAAIPPPVSLPQGYLRSLSPEDRAAAESALVNQTPGRAAVPATPGDETAALWANALTQSNFNPEIISAAFQYLQGAKAPKAPAPPSRTRDVFTTFSRGNRYANYALSQWDSLTEEQKDEYYNDAVKWEQDQGKFNLTLSGSRGGSSGGGGGAGAGDDEWDESKIWRGTPTVQQYDRGYDAYVERNYTINTLGDKVPGESMTKEQWIRENHGDKAWAEYVAESDYFGDPFYKTEQGRLVTELGGVEAAIQRAFTENKGKKWIQVLIDRDNRNRVRAGKRLLDYDTWKAYIASQSQQKAERYQTALTDLEKAQGVLAQAHQSGNQYYIDQAQKAVDAAQVAVTDFLRRGA